MIRRNACRTWRSLNGGMSIAMQSGIQPPVWEIRACTPEALTAFTWLAGRSVIASIWPPLRALTWAVESVKSMIVTVSNHGEPSLRQ